jgi:LPXTG-motif cell wall-anchored protein
VSRTSRPAASAPTPDSILTEPPLISSLAAAARTAAARTSPLGPSLLGILILAGGGVFLVRRVRRATRHRDP